MHYVCTTVKLKEKSCLELEYLRCDLPLSSDAINTCSVSTHFLCTYFRNSFRPFDNDDSLALPVGMEDSLPPTSISPLKDLDDSNISGVSGIHLPKKNAFGTPPSKAKRGKKNKGPSKAAKENLPKEPKPSSSQKQQHPAKSTAVHAISSSDDDDVRASGSTSLSQPIKSTGNKKSNDPMKAMFKNVREKHIRETLPHMRSSK